MWSDVMNMLAAALLTRHITPTVDAPSDDYAAVIASISGLVSWWRFGEASGTDVAIDEESVSNGLYQGGAAPGQSPLPPNTPDTDVLLDGVSGFIETSDHASYHIANGTIVVWFRPSSLGVDRWILSKDVGGLANGDLGFWYRVGDNTLRFQLEDGTSIYRATGTTGQLPTGVLGAGTTYCAVLQFGSGGMKLYLASGDSLQLIGSNAYTGGITANTRNWRFGAAQFSGTAGNFFAGTLGDIMLFNRQLTLDEIETVTVAESAPPSSGTGIAASFPGDVNISSHPSVIIHENFETGSWQAGWTTDPGNFFRATDSVVTQQAAAVHSGSWGFRTILQQVSGSAYGGNFEMVYSTTSGQMKNVVYIRAYIKLDPSLLLGDNGANHISIGFEYEDPAGVPAGTKSNGINHYGTRLQPDFVNGGWNRWMLYTYYMDQPGNFGHNIVTAIGDHPPALGQWQCWEVMGKINTPNVADGEMRAWIDGSLIFQRTNMRWRATSSTAFRRLRGLSPYAHNNNLRDNTVWADDIVIATEYIGPQS